MSLSAIDKNFTASTITLTNGSGRSIVLDTDIGDYKITNVRKLLNEAMKSERKGRLRSVSAGPRIYPQITFSAKVAQFTDATADVVTDFLLCQGKYLGDVGTRANEDHATFDVNFFLEGVDYGDTQDHEFDALDCLPLIEFGEGEEAGMVSIALDVLGAIEGDINAAELA